MIWIPLSINTSIKRLKFSLVNQAMSEINIEAALASVKKKIDQAIARRSKVYNHPVKLVAVSKLKPKELIIKAYHLGQRNFGENYVQELMEKSNDKEILTQCPDIKWHFIGHLQANKINNLLTAPHLEIIETVDSIKLAQKLENALNNNFEGRELKIMVQVNTSNEPNKSGVGPSELCQLIEYIFNKCPHLKLYGLMTIGLMDHDLSKGNNPDFQNLNECKKLICDRFNLKYKDVNLSMGMSNDFEHAIEHGSSCVRVGSAIFGARK